MQHQPMDAIESTTAKALKSGRISRNAKYIPWDTKRD